MLNKIINTSQKIANGLASLFLAALCFLLFMQVFMRYVIQQSLAWSEELNRYMFVWVIFLGINLGIRADIQIKIDLLDTIFREKALTILHFLQYLLSLIAVIACLFSSIYLIDLGFLAKSTILRIPMWVVYLVLPFGCALCIIEICRKIFILLSGKNAAKKNEAVNL
jgi:TRAP-type C4-dicarboxylate transport system permease small subunit